MSRRVIVMSGGLALVTERRGEGPAASQQVHPQVCPACHKRVTAADHEHDLHIPPGPEVWLEIQTCRVRPGPAMGVGIMTRRLPQA